MLLHQVAVSASDLGFGKHVRAPPHLHRIKSPRRKGLRRARRAIHCCGRHFGGLCLRACCFARTKSRKRILRSKRSSDQCPSKQTPELQKPYAANMGSLGSTCSGTCQADSWPPSLPTRGALRSLLKPAGSVDRRRLAGRAKGKEGEERQKKQEKCAAQSRTETGQGCHVLTCRHQALPGKAGPVATREAACTRTTLDSLLRLCLHHERAASGAALFCQRLQR